MVLFASGQGRSGLSRLPFLPKIKSFPFLFTEEPWLEPETHLVIPRVVQTIRRGSSGPDKTVFCRKWIWSQTKKSWKMWWQKSCTGTSDMILFSLLKSYCAQSFPIQAEEVYFYHTRVVHLMLVHFLWSQLIALINNWNLLFFSHAMHCKRL